MVPHALRAQIPDVELSYFDTEGQMQKISSKELCSGKKARRPRRTEHAVRLRG
jgi:hypothetical protein